MYVTAWPPHVCVLRVWELHGLSSDSWVAPVLSPLPISVGGLTRGALARWRREAVAGRFGQLCVVDHTTAARTSWRQLSRGVAGLSGAGIRICTTTARGERSRGDTTLVNCGRDSSRARLLADNRYLSSVFFCCGEEMKRIVTERMFASLRVRMVNEHHRTSSHMQVTLRPRLGGWPQP